ncbi:unnamed protein product [Dovyalis caffra]|uniref:Uncharacterized protein n=1 Tax=Dovyalis caffra TaxID=77055 RepID=A0AAV1SY24_9ROSI|nr:unnamed protein product [Dovyalis caffra]
MSGLKYLILLRYYDAYYVFEIPNSNGLKSKDHIEDEESRMRSCIFALDHNEASGTYRSFGKDDVSLRIVESAVLMWSGCQTANEVGSNDNDFKASGQNPVMQHKMNQPDNSVVTSDQEQMKALSKRLDFIMYTASGDNPFDPYLLLLKTAGVLVLVGVPSEYINEAPERLLKNDVNYRFIIDALLPTP